MAAEFTISSEMNGLRESKGAFTQAVSAASIPSDA